MISELDRADRKPPSRLKSGRVSICPVIHLIGCQRMDLTSASGFVGRPSSGGAAGHVAGRLVVHLRELGNPVNRPLVPDEPSGHRRSRLQHRMHRDPVVVQDRQAEHVYVLLDALRVRHAPPHVPRVVRPYREVEPLHQSGAGIAEVGLSRAPPTSAGVEHPAQRVDGVFAARRTGRDSEEDPHAHHTEAPMTNEVREALKEIESHAEDSGDGGWFETLVRTHGPAIRHWNVDAVHQWRKWPERTTVFPDSSPDDIAIDLVAERRSRQTADRHPVQGSARGKRNYARRRRWIPQRGRGARVQGGMDRRNDRAERGAPGAAEQPRAHQGSVPAAPARAAAAGAGRG